MVDQIRLMQHVEAMMENSDSKRKIALLGPAPPLRGGISQFAVHLGHSLLESGCDVRMISFTKQYPDILFPSGDQNDPDALPSGITTIQAFAPYLPYTWGKAVRAIRDYAPEMLIVSYWLPFFAPSYAWILSRLRGIKIVFLAHNVVSHEKWPMGGALRDMALRKADKLVVLSQCCLQDVKESLPLHVVRNTVLGFHPIYDSYAEFNPEQEVVKSLEFTLLFFGLVKPYKGLDVLLKALKLLLDRGKQVRLIIAGDVYGNRREYDEMIETLQIGDWCECHFRYISDKEIGQFFRQTDLCVLPYKTATQSGVIATSYSFNVPVLASDVGGLSEYIIPEKTGFLVKPDDPVALADGIEAVMHRERTEAMAEDITHYKARYSWKALSELFLSL